MSLPTSQYLKPFLDEINDDINKWDFVVAAVPWTV